MKVRAVLAAAVVLVAATAGAQQRPEPLPTNTDDSANQTKLPVMHFPCQAAQYDLYLKWELGMLQGIVGRGPITQGDMNKVTLRVRDCASRVEADGYVTEGEFKYCHRQLQNTLREIGQSYQLTQ